MIIKILRRHYPLTVESGERLADELVILKDSGDPYLAAAAKARGVKLGSPDPRKGFVIGVAVNKGKADRHAANVVPIIREIEASGVTSNLGIAKALNARGVPTARGGEWYDSTVKNAKARNP